METRRLIVALAVAFGVFLLYRMAYDRIAPPPPSRPPTPPATQPAEGGGPVTTSPAAERLVTAPSTPPLATSAAAWQFSQAPEIQELELGGGENDKIQVALTSHGASLESIRLTERKKDGDYVHRKDAETKEPYLLVQPVEAPPGPQASYLTRQIWLGESAWRLDDLAWELVERSSHSATFTTTLRSVEGAKQRLRVSKTYALKPGSPLVELRLKLENLSGESFELKLEQDGPVGIRKENAQYDMRRLVRARRLDQKVDTDAYSRSDLKETIKLGSSAEQFVWVALANKYFAVFTRPLPQEGGAADYVWEVGGSVVLPGLRNGEPDPGDYLARIFTKPQKIGPGDATEYAFEIYAGTKNEQDLEKANPAFADRRRVGYVAARDADQRCCCTFPFLTSFMTGLLETIQVMVRNYGVAIIVLVLVIRALLHPLSVFQQKSMYRMQEAQARLQPKLAALKEKHANDKVKYNQEMMKLYGEEGVNPMASMVGMLPMLVQMPILIALWTALNTDVHLRHAGFDPWWITDLSAPDEFIEFGGDGVTIPILGWLPLIGQVFTNIPALNLLPILMGVSMWLQQKYMPKPGMQAKLEAIKKNPAQEKPQHKSHGMSPEEQLRQQRMIAYMMAIVFPLMFYKMPSGLNLYWMATNVFGILESLRIRKQIEAEKKRRELLGTVPAGKPKKAGVVGRVLKHMAERAEDLQKRADALSKEESRRGPKKTSNQRKR